MAPAKDVKMQQCCNLQHFVTLEKRKIVRKICQTALFPILGTLKTGGGMLLETLLSDPDSVPKALPHQAEGFLVFFGAPRRRVGGLGRASPQSSIVALGRSWGKPLVWSRQSRINRRAAAPTRRPLGRYYWVAAGSWCGVPVLLACVPHTTPRSRPDSCSQVRQAFSLNLPKGSWGLVS